MVHLRILDIIVLVVYFASMTLMGWYFTRRAKSSEGYFVGNRAYNVWYTGRERTALRYACRRARKRHGRRLP
jgi:hypothetical protein